MRLYEVIAEGAYDYSVADYGAVPYDAGVTKDYIDRKAEKNPNVGPQEGKVLNLMLRGMKPLTQIGLPDDKKLFEPYIKDGTFTLTVGRDVGGTGDRARWWYITLPGQEWRARRAAVMWERLHKLMRDGHPRSSPQVQAVHARLGMLLGIPKEAIRWFINK